jgi:hypothetical protein
LSKKFEHSEKNYHFFADLPKFPEDGTKVAKKGKHWFWLLPPNHQGDQIVLVKKSPKM